MTTLDSAPLAPLLESLFLEAETQASPRERVAAAQVTPEEHERLRTSSEAADYRRLFGLMRDSYLAVSRDTGRLLYMFARSTGARCVVEFGTSFGISTLHLAAAVRDNGGGLIVTSELETTKAERARQNFAAAGLADLIDVRPGDALQTLAQDLPDSIDLVLLDGAKPLYPAVLALLESRLRPGALVLADNAGRSPEFLDHVRSPASGYIFTPLADDVALVMRSA